LVTVDCIQGGFDLAAVRWGIVAEGFADRVALGIEFSDERLGFGLPGALEAELGAAPLHEECRALADRGEDRAEAQAEHQGENQRLGRR
jgi:hypothetical protein